MSWLAQVKIMNWLNQMRKEEWPLFEMILDEFDLKELQLWFRTMLVTVTTYVIGAGAAAAGL